MSRLTLRLPETLHRQLEAQARREGVSLNQYIVYALSCGSSPRTTRCIPCLRKQWRSSRPSSPPCCGI